MPATPPPLAASQRRPSTTATLGASAASLLANSPPSLIANKQSLLYSDHVTSTPTTRPLTVVVTNHKGGVGKTSVCLGLASAARAAGIRCLVVDSDPQAAASFALDVGEPEWTLNDVLYSRQRGGAVDAIAQSSWGEGIYCLPSERALESRVRDVQLGDEFRLREALDSPELAQMVDLILIDSPPSLNLLMTGALIAADYYLLIAAPSAFSSHAIGTGLVETIDTVQRQYNPKLEQGGLILNKVPFRGREASFRIGELAEAFGDDAIWRPYLPPRNGIDEANGAKRPYHDHFKSYDRVPQAFDSYLERILAWKDQ